MLSTKHSPRGDCLQTSLFGPLLHCTFDLSKYIYLLLYIYIYIECHSTCDSCSGPCSNNCLKCYSTDLALPAYNSCYSICPASFYPDILLKECVKCPAKCLLCENDTYCTSCSFGFYLNRENNSCVIAIGCPLSTTAIISTRVCEGCADVCEVCDGTGFDDCIQCKSSKGLLKKNLMAYKSGWIELFCMSGYYKKEFPNGSKSCILCHSNCKECNGDSNSECLECESNRVFVFNQSGRFCTQCSDLHPGYINNKEHPGVCLEICGDGRYMGILECDDGNLVDGDGCSSQCLLEAGFICVLGDQENPQVCSDSVGPQANIISLSLEYVLLLGFNEVVTFSLLTTGIYIYIYYLIIS